MKYRLKMFIISSIMKENNARGRRHEAVEINELEMRKIKKKKFHTA